MLASDQISNSKYNRKLYKNDWDITNRRNPIARQNTVITYQIRDLHAHENSTLQRPFILKLIPLFLSQTEDDIKNKQYKRNHTRVPISLTQTIISNFKLFYQTFKLSN